VTQPRSFLGRIARHIPGLARILNAFDRTRDDLNSTRVKLASARAKVQAQADQFQRRIEQLEAANRELKAATAARMPQAAVLEQSVALRHLALLASSSRRTTARVLEAQLRDHSTAYREVQELGDRRVEGCDGPILAHGLRWWIPRQVPLDPGSLEANVANGRLPLKAILASRELAQGSIMLDIGANIGTTSIPRVVLGDFQHVYAAEPEPRNFACLVHNVVVNDLAGFVLPDRVAIGASDGELTMRVSGHMGAHRVIDRSAGRARPNRAVVPSRSLDSWVDSLAIDLANVAFIKCDVQGWEVRVLEGASRVLQQRHIVWQFEVSPKHLEKAGSSLSEFCAVVRSHFDHFINLSGQGPHIQPASQLETALASVGRARRFTDILAYNTEAGGRQ